MFNMPTTFANTSYKRQWKQKDSDNQMQMSDEVEQNWNRNWIQPLATQQEQHGKLFAVRVFFFTPPGIFLPHFEGRKMGKGKRTSFACASKYLIALYCGWMRRVLKIFTRKRAFRKRKRESEEKDFWGVRVFYYLYQRFSFLSIYN